MRIFRSPRLRFFSRLDLLARFGVLSFACLVALGLLLAQTLSTQIHNRALASSAQSATLIARFGIQPQVTGVDLQNGLAPETITALDQLLRSGYTSSEVRAIVVWNAAGRIVYSPDRSLIGRGAAHEPSVWRALSGRAIATAGAGHGGGDKVIEAFVPLRVGSNHKPAGAFEVHLRYAPIAQAITRDTHRLYLALVIGLLAVWAVLFRIVQGASKRLRRQSAQNEYQAHHDMLTNLPNRQAFYARVEEALASARSSSAAVGVMIVDLDRFKEVNDTLGHHSGDLLLRHTAERLTGTLRGGDVLARLGGDEFAVLLPDLPSCQTAAEVAERIGEALELPFTLQGLTVHIEASIGVALHPDHGDDAETLLQRADVAMYAAKSSSAGYELYAADHDRHTPGRLALLGELKRALDENQLELHYQPKAGLRDGRVTGVEALVRWNHPERGLVPPLEFIPLAEQTGLIKPLTAWVLDAALAQCRAWCDRGQQLNVAVNLSVRNLLDVHLPDSIAELLRKHGLPPQRLELEITESTIVGDQVRALDVLTRLHDMGLSLAVDDFGTGYSSLAYLKDLPVRELKIDRKFVNNMTEDGDDAFIVRSTIDLGRNLGLQVVAEGVETAAVWDQLLRLGCDVAQGYYLSRPLPPAELDSWFAGRANLDIEIPDFTSFVEPS